MKMQLYRLRFPSFGALALALLPVLVSPALAQLPAGAHASLPNYDKRAATALRPEQATQRESAHQLLRRQVPAVSVDFDPLLGTPAFIRANDGFLSGPGGEGRAVSKSKLAALPASDSYRPIKAFINEHAALFGHDASILDTARVKRDYTDAHNGLHTVAWEQRFEGLPVYRSVLLSHITKDGEVTSLSSLFVPAPGAAADAGTPDRAVVQGNPPISASRALQLAAEAIEASLSEAQIQDKGTTVGEGGYRLFETPAKAYVRAVWLPLSRAEMRLAWETIVEKPETRETYLVVIDALSGEAQVRTCLTQHISDATYNVYTSDSPSPFSPGLQTPGTYQPPLTTRTMVTLSALDTNASPAGWIDDGNNTTTGNNADAFVDRDWDVEPDQPRPIGTNRVFDFAMDLSLDPSNYVDASIVQLFYDANVYHDRLYQLGFTEAAGNFQSNNFSRGGLGNDQVICLVQAGAGVGVANNSMFSSLPDGMSGQCNMFVFDGPTPTRDGALDTEVVFHEFTHGTSWRLVGGGMALGNAQGDGMGEGWGDFYGLCLLSQNGDNPNAAYAFVGYATYLFYGLNQNYYYGIRHFPYCTDMGKNPFTFKDIDPGQISPHAGVPRSPISPFYAAEASEVHHQGEIWCSTLWQVRANLVTKYGWAIGNQLVLQLVTDGMKLTPPSPNMLQARDAILLADRIYTGGANQVEIWRGFAKRGMGISARSPAGTTTSGVVESFDMPGMLVGDIFILNGNGNGAVDPNECNDLQVQLYNNSGDPATGISARLATTTPGVIVAQAVSSYADTAPGVTNVNVTNFKLSTASYFVCGTPIDLTLTVKTDQSTTTNQFRLFTGTPLTPVRFDNSTPMLIPDGGTTNSVIVVSNINSAITKVTVSLNIAHSFDADLLIQLVSPEGITNTLSANNGSGGQNYGINCSPDTQRTTFDDGATAPISTGVAPFAGEYKPDQALSMFIGKSGTNVNGAWRLQVSDQYTGDTGMIQCWSLNLSPVACAVGGGECPGADLAIGMRPAPDPLVLGNYLTYTISITNRGPSAAKNVAVSQILPSGCMFISATASQGGCSQVGGVVTANLGQVNALGRATVTIVVLPSLVGVATSTATASSEQTDPDMSNNNVTVSTQVLPPTADLAVGLGAMPNSAVVGDTLTYTVGVTNYGPSTATAVVATNILPSSFTILSVTASQGSVSVQGNAVVFVVGNLTNSAYALATIKVKAAVEGTFAASSTVVGSPVIYDPVLANNVAAISTVVGPAADLVVSVVAAPEPVVLQSNLTYTVTVSNRGPSVATSVMLNSSLHASENIVSYNASQGTIAVQGKTVTATLGTLAPSATATVVIRVVPTVAGPVSATATATAAQPDPVLGNNTVTIWSEVSHPFISIVPGGVVLVSESHPNGAIDIGETVTVSLRLRNAGNAVNTNLVATLLAGHGVTPVAPNTPQTYGVVAPGGFPIARSFSFVANGSPGGTISAVLDLKDGGNSLSNQPAFTFTLPLSLTFANTNVIDIRDASAADPYPSSISVSNVSGLVGQVTATLTGLSHSYPHDVNVLLVAPNGAKSLLLSHAGTASNTVDLTFDALAEAPVPANGQLLSGTWRPSAYEVAPFFELPAPAGPYSTSFESFNGINPNGDWALYVNDDYSGDFGVIRGGWSLSLTAIAPINQIADVGLSLVAPPSPSGLGNNLVYTYTITNAGPNPAAFVTFSNPLPAGATFVAAASSQGTISGDATGVVGSLGPLSMGTNITVTVTLVPSAAGWITNQASISSIESDLNGANNSVTSVTSVVLPVSALVLSQTASPNPGVVGFSFTNTIQVSNLGPSPALSTVLAAPVPAGASFVSASSSLGQCTNVDGTVLCSLGDLPVNAAATLTVVLTPAAAGTLADVVAVTTGSANSNAGSSRITNMVPVVLPTPHLVAAGASLLSESGPVNGAVDVGETVTVSLALANDGTANTANLVASLVASGGVTPLSGPQSYGVVAHGGAAGGTFTFVANGTAGSVVTATLQLQDGATDLGTVEYAFNLPEQGHWASSGAIAIPDHGVGAPYPSSIDVAGMRGLVSKVTVTLDGLSHSFPRDVSVLLVSPTGRNVLLMSHAGGGYALTNVTLTFDDDVSGSLANNGRLVSGRVRPGSYSGAVTFAAPAPAKPYGNSLSALNGGEANGRWSLFVLDDSNGDGGSLAGGWSLDITTVTTVNAVADVAVALSSTPGNLYVGGVVTSTLTLTNFGPAAATGVLVTHALPLGSSLVSASPAVSSQVVDGVLYLNVGTLASAGGTIVQVVTAPSIGGTLTNQFAVSANEYDVNLVNNVGQTVTTVQSPLPISLSAVAVDGAIRLTLTAEPGLTYLIQSSVSVDPPVWSNLSTNTASAAGIIKLTDPIQPNAAGLYYRAVRVLP